jgi:O-antigen/teichoic acid export membrane protein
MPRERSLHELVRFVGPSMAMRPVLTLVVSILIARTLGPEGRGDYGVAATALSVLPLVCGLGFDPAIRFWSARGEVDRSQLLRSISLLGLALGALVAAIGFGTYLLRSPTWLVPESMGPLGAAGLCLALGLSNLKGFWTNYLVGQERYGFATWGTNLAAVAQALLLVVWWQVAGVTLDAALVSLGAQLAFSFALFFALAGREFAKALRAPFLRLADLRGMMRFGLWEWLGELLTQTNLRLNVFLLAALGGSYETGLYTAVMGPANFLLLVASPLNLVLTARTARRSQDAAFRERVAGALRVVLVMSAAPALVAAALASPVLVWIFGEEFAAGVPAFQLALPGMIALSLVRLVAQYLGGARRPDWNTRIAALGAALTVGLNALLIPRHGATGAALATTLADLGALLLSLVAVLQVSGLSLRELLAFRRADWIPLARVLRLGEPRRAP